MADSLPAAANLAIAPRCGRLRRLATGVGVDLGVEHEDVDVAARGQDVVEPAEADVVGPAVAADDPHALADQGAGQREQMAGRVGRRRRRRRPTSRPSSSSSSRDAPPLGEHGLLVVLAGVPGSRRPARGRPRRRARRAGREPSAAGPRGRAGCPGRTRRCPRTGSCSRPARALRRSWPTASSAGCRRRSTSSPWRWPPASGRRTAGWPASGTASPRTRHRLRRTRTAAGGPGSPSPSRGAAGSGRAPGWTGRSPSAPAPVAVHERRLHVDGLVLDLGLGLGRADVDADPAAGAVVGERPGSSVGDRAGPWNGRAWTRSPPARRRALRAGRPSCGCWRAGRRWCTCRSRCRCPGPRSGSPLRWPASRSGSSRTGSGRPRGGRTRATGRPCRP